jgi:hypothetical protein
MKFPRIKSIYLVASAYSAPPKRNPLLMGNFEGCLDVSRQLNTAWPVYGWLLPLAVNRALAKSKRGLSALASLPISLIQPSHLSGRLLALFGSAAKPGQPFRPHFTNLFARLLAALPNCVNEGRPCVHEQHIFRWSCLHIARIQGRLPVMGHWKATILPQFALRLDGGPAQWKAAVA